MQPNLSQYVSNLNSLTDQLEERETTLERIKSSLGTLSDMKGALERASKDADKVKFVVDDLHAISTMLKLFPATRGVGTQLSRLLENVADRAEDISDLLAEHKTKITVFGAAINTAKLAVYQNLLDVYNDLGDLTAIEASLNDLNSALSEDPAALDPRTAAALDRMDATFAMLNTRFPQQALDEMAAATDALDNALAPFAAVGAIVLEFRDGLDAVAGLLNGIGNPLGDVVDALDPLLWVLEKAENVIDAVVSPVIDPLTEALGIDALMDHVEQMITGLLPDLSGLNPLDDIPTRFPAIFGTAPDYDMPMVTRIQDIYGARDDLPGLDPARFLASRIFGEEGYVAPLLGEGTSGDDVLLGRNELIFWASELDGAGGSDVLSAGIGEDTLRGGVGDDVIINAGGDDLIFGGAGYDTLYSFAPLSQFSFTAETRVIEGARRDVLNLNHLGGYVGGLVAGFGEDTIADVESYVFGLTVLSYQQLATAIRVDYEVSNQVQGTGADDLLLGGERPDDMAGAGGNDILISSDGYDTLDGGAGTDVADYSSVNTTGVRAALRAVDQARLGNMSDLLIGIENLLGSSRGDMLVGSDGANRLNGARGDDTIAGLGGADTLTLGAGADLAAGGAGDDTIESLYGMDTILGGRGDDRYIFGRDDNAGDLIFYGLHDTPLMGGVGAAALVPVQALDGTLVQPHRITVATAGPTLLRVAKYDATGALIGTDTADAVGANIVGTDRNDSFTLGVRFAYFDGGAGHDTFTGAAINHRDRWPDEEDVPPALRAYGGAGADRFISYTLEENFVGGAGNDRYVFVETDEADDALRTPLDDPQLSYFFGGEAPEGFFELDETVDPIRGLSSFAPRDPASMDRSGGVDTGLDTLDLSEAFRYWLIDVPNNALSSRDFIGRDGVDPFGPVDNRLAFFGVETFLGGPLNDWLVHGDTDITFWAGRGRDTILPGLNGGQGNLIAHGGQDEDSFTSGMGVDQLFGDQGNDYLRNNGNHSTTPGETETLSGGAGNDFLTIGSRGQAYAGVLTDFDGGTGQDFAEMYLGSGDQVVLDLRSTGYTLNGQGAGLAGIEGVIIHGADARITGTNAGDAIQTGDGADRIDSGGGDDIVATGDGDDTLRGGAGDDILNPGAGNATVDGASGQDALSLNGRFDYQPGQGVSFGDGNRTIVDWLFDLDAARVRSDSGTISYTNIERFSGGWGDDTMRGTAGADYLEGQVGTDSLIGAGGNDTLSGGRDDDTIWAGAGDDVINPGTGFDLVGGGAGHDILQIDADIEGLILRGLTGVATGTKRIEVEVAPGVGIFTTVTYPSADRFSGIEEIALTKQADDAEGTTGNDSIRGLLGADTLRGLGGDDSLSGGDGDDLILGDGRTELPRMASLNQNGATSGLRIDTLSVMPTTAMTVEMMVQAGAADHTSTLMSYGVSGSTNEFTLITNPSHTFLEVIINGQVTETTLEVADLFDGGLHRLSVVWNSQFAQLSVYLDGGLAWSDFNLAGADQPIQAGGTLIFGQDQDGTTPGGGFDPDQAYHGAIGDIRIFETVRTEDDIADNALRDGVPDDTPGLRAGWRFEGDTLAGQQAFGAPLRGFGTVTLPDPGVLSGPAGSDLLNGGAGADTLRGGDGTDTLIGGDGDDLILGGDSAADLRDLLYGGAGHDTLDGGHGNDELRGDAGDDQITGGFGVDSIFGADGDDILTGQAWSDLIFGGAGDDFINGGFGFDRLNGGAGGDQFFHLGVAGHGSDWIQDFRTAQGDVLVFGGAAGSVDDFLVQSARTAGAGAANVQELFVTHIPSGNLLWALVDGAAQSQLMIRIGGAEYDLLA